MVAIQSGVMTAGLWGSLLSRARYKGTKGAIIDSISRDPKAIKEMGFPIFAKGRIKIIGYNQPIKCGGLWVNPEDVVFGDDNREVVAHQKITL